jgi:DNA-binding MarR family transcriptional regulator
MADIGELPSMDDDPRLRYDAWPFYWLTRAHTHYQNALAAMLAGTILDAPSWRIVMILRDEGWLTVSSIAARANAKLSTTTKAVQRMDAMGLVETRSASMDRRATEVKLTDLGRDQTKFASQTANHLFQRAFSTMEPDKLEQLQTLLREVAENLR